MSPTPTTPNFTYSADRAWKLLIDGELVDGANGTAPIVNPATEEVVGHAPEVSVDQALDAARGAGGIPGMGGHSRRRARPAAPSGHRGVVEATG